MQSRTSKDERDAFDLFYVEFLKVHMRLFEQLGRGKADPAEVERYQVMRPFRDYVMDRYRVVRSFSFGNHVLFELDPSKANQAHKEPL